MKNFSSRFLQFFALALVLLFAACEKDEVNSTVLTPNTPTTTTVVTTPVVSRMINNRDQVADASTTSGLLIECLTIDIPFEFEVDSEIYTIWSADGLDSVLTYAFTPNTMSADFVYPLSITLEDGTSTTAADGDELSMLISACIPGSGWGTGHFPAFFFDAAPCLSLSYPITLDDLNGNQAVVNDEAEFINFLAANPNYTFVFPLTVVDSSGSMVSVSDVEELFDLLGACSNSGNGGGHGGSIDELFFLTGEGCFDYNYPINLIDINGNIVPVLDDNELVNAILNGNFTDFEYGFSVTKEADGSQLVIADGNDFVDLINSCYGSVCDGIPARDFIAIALNDSCYSLVYPFDILVDGSTVTITNQTEAADFLMVAINSYGTLVLPVNVESNGQAITLNTEQDYYNVLSTCGSTGIDNIPAVVFLSIGLDNSGCYTLTYPLSITNPDGTTLVITTEAEAIDYLQTTQGDGSIDFPVEVILSSTGASVTLTTIEDFFAILDNC